MNVFFASLILALFLVLLYLRWVSAPRLLRWMNGRPLDDNSPVWQNVRLRLAEACKRHRVPVPHLWILPEFSPNALILRPWGGRVYLALTEGLVRALSEEELDCALSLCLAHGNQRGRSFQTCVGSIFFPLARIVQGYPLPAQILLSPVLNALLRLAIGPSHFLKADLAAANFQTQWRIAAALQKLSVMGRKIPLRHWNLALDSLFLVSPLALDETPFLSFLAQPSVEARRRQLLERPTCESAASLP